MAVDAWTSLGDIRLRLNFGLMNRRNQVSSIGMSLHPVLSNKQCDARL
jgi:hypothetical protein